MQDKNKTRDFLEGLRKQIIDIRESFGTSSELEEEIVHDHWFPEECGIQKTDPGILVRRRMLLDIIWEKQILWSRLNGLLVDVVEFQMDEKSS